jgi:hypothetical protein
VWLPRRRHDPKHRQGRALSLLLLFEQAKEKVARGRRPATKQLHEGPSEFRQAYARLLLDEVRITDEIRITGPKAVLAHCAAEGGVEPVPRVLSDLFESGAPEGIRTSDLCLRRATLYPAELRAHRRPGRPSPS